MTHEEGRPKAAMSVAAPDHSTNLEHAVAYAAAGWRVFPCLEAGPQAKAPRTPHGHLDASSDPDLITHWWTRWPNALIGASVPDAHLVLDIDPRNGGSLDALEELVGGSLPETLTCWSGRGDGGRHLYFLRPPGALTSTRLPEGIDLKVNGYVIVPPSLHPATGLPYRWEEHPIAAPTGRLRELLRAPAPRQVSPMGDTDGAPLVRFVARMTAGERNTALFWAACRAAEAGILDSLAFDLVGAAVGAGINEREAHRTIQSAARTVGR